MIDVISVFVPFPVPNTFQIFPQISLLHCGVSSKKKKRNRSSLHRYFYYVKVAPFSHSKEDGSTINMVMCSMKMEYGKNVYLRNY